MTQYDILSRASAFAIDITSIAKEANVTRPSEKQFPETDEEIISTVGFHPIVTSLHVVRPFLFPRYYPEEWLQFVRPENIRVTLEFRDNETGELKHEFPLLPKVFAHPTRDVALLFADLDAISEAKEQDIDVVGAVERIAYLEDAVDKHQLVDVDNTIGKKLVCCGHFLNENPDSESCKPQPGIVVGEVAHTLDDPDMILAGTELILQAGMCGGPVVDEEGNCVGMVEGVVQNAPADGQFKDGLAALLPSRTIRELAIQVLEGESGERHHPPHN